MTQISRLHLTSQSQHTEIDNKRQLAQSMRNSADQHEANGNTTQADLDRKSADRYDDEVTRLEQQVGVTDKQLYLAMKKRDDLDGEIKQLEQEYLKKLENLKGERSKLDG